MTPLSIIISIVASVFLAILVDRLLDKFVIDDSKLSHLISVILAIVLLVILVAWPNLQEINSRKTTATASASVKPTATATRTPTPTPVPTPKPQPKILGKADFFDNLATEKFFPPGQGLDGRSWYENGGYNVLSLDSKRSWMWVMPDFSFRDSVIEVDVTPITHDSVTGYVVVTAWTTGNNYHMFIVRPNGSCDFVGVEANEFIDYDKIPRCPPPVQGKTVRVRLEIYRDSMNDEISRVRAFIADEFMFEKTIPNNEGGLIGLGAYNGGEHGSKVEAQVQFENLTIWDISDTPNLY